MNNFGRKIKITIGRAAFTNDDLEIRFEVPFDDDYKPNESNVQIYNLSENTLSQFKIGDTVTIEAGYGDDIGVLSVGKLSQKLTKWEGPDKITSLYSIEGDDFTHVKVSVENADKYSIKRYTEGPYKGQVIQDALKIGFNPGTKASTIVNRLVSVLGIKLAHPPILVKDITYPKGFLVTKIIINDLETVVKDCGSAIYHRRGKLVIRPITQGFDENFLVEENTGLMEPPSAFEEEGAKGYNVKSLLQHRIITASIINIKSKTANGKYRVRKGKHIADADDFYSQFEVI